MEHAHHSITQEKARKILKHGKVGGKALTRKQRGFLGLIAGGGTATRMKGHKSSHLREILG